MTDPSNEREHKTPDAGGGAESSAIEAPREGEPEPTTVPSSAEPLPWVSWLYSLILPLGVWLTLVTAFIDLRNGPDVVEFLISDSSTGEPIPGAELVIDRWIYRADDLGEVTIARPNRAQKVTITAEGYVAVVGELTRDARSEQLAALQPASLVGTVSDAASGEPISGATVSVFGGDGMVVSSTSTDDSGHYRLTGIPAQATLHVEVTGYDRQSIDVSLDGALNIDLAPDADATPVASPAI